jgi:hypothetical protein
MDFWRMRLMRESTGSWLTVDSGEPLSLDEWEQVVQIAGLHGWVLDEFYILCQAILEDERWNW